MRTPPQLQGLRDRYTSLPYLTTLIAGTLIALRITGLFFSGVNGFLALNPSAVLHGGFHRLLTYPLVHQNFMHLLFNFFALIPVLSVFEEETGTVGTAGCLALFSVAPGVAYVFISLFTGSTTTLGASGWVFSLMAYFALKDAAIRSTIYINPRFQIPTWSTPLLTLLVIAILLPASSFLGHLLGLAVGYAYGLGYLEQAKLPQQLILKAETALSARQLTKALPRFISDDSASKHRVVFDGSMDAGVPSGSTSPVLGAQTGGTSSPFSGQGRPLGS
ncbi:hypothetical protein BZA70DRAFT_313154 [Myxozyma melibiosi]|uniref:Rhomboid-type serine protease 2 n=1 Tax=Myxozyma melibiosi TaxID=54550 RepID=A0ABR1EYS6_9ASCO